ncbi:MAG: methyltransferase domain-containing protein [Deltaproteobacteria bacterium]|nr:methyltransferase domain-containing protein [Deltaproteobacteria bacterium]
MPALSDRVQLYRTLADEGRLRLLALAQQEALTVGELAELLHESQPQTSRKAAALRQAGILDGKKDGTRTFLHVATPSQSPDVADPSNLDVVVQDALDEGRRLVTQDGSLARIPEILARREEAGRALFDKLSEDLDDDKDLVDDPQPWPAHLRAAAEIFPQKELLVDVGCGEGSALDVLAPFFKRVLAVDRSRSRLAKCAKRMRKRAYPHVQLVEASFDDADLVRRIDSQGKACVVFAGRILHHVSRPQDALSQMARMLKPEGQLLLLDYAAHDDEKQREEQGDVWLGFSEDIIKSHLASAGLHLQHTLPIHEAHRGRGPDAHLPWQLSVATLASQTSKSPATSSAEDLPNNMSPEEGS